MQVREVRVVGDVVYVPLGGRSNEYAMVDLIDLPLVEGKNWCKTSHGYACRNARVGGVFKQEYLHRLILGGEEYVDHINGNRLDDRRSNIRHCTQSQNMLNQKPQTQSKSGIKNIYQIGRKWQVRVMVGGRRVYGGKFIDLDDAVACATKIRSEGARIPVRLR